MIRPVCVESLFHLRYNRRCMDLNEILVFSRVVQAGSFTAAARELGLPKSTVSRKVSALEERLGARLLQRTTRKLSVTDAGRAFAEQAGRALAELEEAEHGVQALQARPRGLLRVTAPLNFAFMAPIIDDFLASYPDIQLALTCSDRVVNLVEENFDLAIRAGALSDSSLVVRTLARMKSYLCASPGYLGKHGHPKRPADLAAHACLLFGTGRTRGWHLVKGRRTLDAPTTAHYVVNDYDMLHSSALAGVGIAMLPVHLCIADLRAHRLERVLPEWCSEEVPVSAVYPSTRHLLPKMRAFLDHLQARMNPPPWELGPRP